MRRKPVRKPHPDPRVEARLQHVLSLYASVRRAEDRIGNINAELYRVGDKIRNYANHVTVGRRMTEQSAQLRAERARLEGSISQAHEDITKMLVDLGDDALYLGPAS